MGRGKPQSGGESRCGEKDHIGNAARDRPNARTFAVKLWSVSSGECTTTQATYELVSFCWCAMDVAQKQLGSWFGRSPSLTGRMSALPLGIDHRKPEPLQGRLPIAVGIARRCKDQF